MYVVMYLVASKIWPCQCFTGSMGIMQQLCVQVGSRFTHVVIASLFRCGGGNRVVYRPPEKQSTVDDAAFVAFWSSRLVSVFHSGS